MTLRKRRFSKGTTLAFFAMGLCIICPRSGAARRSQSPPVEEKARADQVVARGSLSQEVVTQGSVVRFDITVQNMSSQPVLDMRLVRLQIPGFDTRSLCLDRGGVTSCSRFPAGGYLIASNLHAGQTNALWGDLVAQEAHPRQVLKGALRWRDAQGIESELPVSLGECLIRGRWDRHLDLLSQITKDFALPLVLVLLGIGYQWRDRKREQVRQEEEGKRTILNQTWNSMLPISHQYATEHYSPMAAYLGKALSEISRYKGGSSQPPREGRRQNDVADLAFYYFCLFFRHRRHLVGTVGGLYFKNRVGEALAVSCMDKFVELYIDGRKDRQIEFSALLNYVQLHETSDIFFGKLAGKTPVESKEMKGTFDRARQHFQEWLDSARCDDDLLFLEGFMALLKFEMNRPYEHWYGSSEKLRITAQIRNKIEEAAKWRASTRGDFALVQDADKYLGSN